MPVTRKDAAGKAAIITKEGKPMTAKEKMRQAKIRAKEKQRSHREKVAPAGFASKEYFAMVHTPISVKEAMKTPAGRAALEKEWVKLESKNAWLTDTGREYEDVRAEAARGPNKREVHFGRVFPLCHIKNSQLAEEFWTYKGRVVFEGNYTTDQDRT